MTHVRHSVVAGNRCFKKIDLSYKKALKSMAQREASNIKLETVLQRLPLPTSDTCQESCTVSVRRLRTTSTGRLDKQTNIRPEAFPKLRRRHRRHAIDEAHKNKTREGEKQEKVLGI
jgi:hypothetical protein